MFEQTRDGTELGSRLGRRVQEDAAFRQQVLADPKAAVEKECGAPDRYLVLPLAPGAAARRPASQQLSNADLVSAAGEREDPPPDPPPPGYPPPCFDCIGQGCLD